MIPGEKLLVHKRKSWFLSHKNRRQIEIFDREDMFPDDTCLGRNEFRRKGFWNRLHHKSSLFWQMNHMRQE